MGAGRSQAPIEGNGLAPGVGGSSRNLHSASSSMENYSRLSSPGPLLPLEKDPEAPSSNDETEFLFDQQTGGLLDNLFVETKAYHYKLLEPQVAVLFAKRSSDEIWNTIIALKLSTDPDEVERVFKKLDDQGCFNPHQEWRGYVGETVFHICFLLMPAPDGMPTNLGKLAVMINKKNPRLAVLPYGPGIYDGEVPLHLAIAHNDITAVRWLLEHGATVNGHNAIGSFFARFLWGEHPLAWAACSNKVDILKVLLEAEGDVNQLDTHKNTLVHNMAVSPMIWDAKDFKKIFLTLKQHDRTVMDQFNEFNEDDRTPLQIASAHMEGNFNAILECLKDILWIFGEVECSKYLLKGWDSAHSRQFQDGQACMLKNDEEEVSAVEVAVLENNHTFFCTPLNQLLLKTKWTLFVRREFGHRATYFCAFVAVSTGSALFRDGFKVAMFLRLWSFFLGAFMLILSCCTFIRVRKTYFFRSIQSLVVKSFLLDLHKSFACLGILLAIGLQCYLDYLPVGSDRHHTITTYLYGMIMPVALLISWICTCELLLLHEYLCGVFLVVIEIVRLELPVWLFLQSLLLAAFSSALYIATSKVYNDEEETMAIFSSLFQTTLSLALVPLGGIADAPELTTTSNNYIVCGLYLAYSTLSCVLFLNLTIALFTETTRNVWENKDRYYYTVVSLLCIAEEKRRLPRELKRFWVGSKLGDGKHYLLVQKFKKHDEQKFD